MIAHYKFIMKMNWSVLFVVTMTITTMVIAGQAPSQELLDLLDKLDQAKKNVPTYGVDTSESVSEEIKNFGIKDEQVEDLNKMADRMFQFLAKAMARIGQSSSQVDIFYNSQLYLLGLPNSLGPLGYFALQGLEDNIFLTGEVEPAGSPSSLRRKRSLGLPGLGTLGGLGGGLGGLPGLGALAGGLGALGGLGGGLGGLPGLGAVGGLAGAGVGFSGVIPGAVVLGPLLPSLPLLSLPLLPSLGSVGAVGAVGAKALGVAGAKALLLKGLAAKVGKVLLLKKLSPLSLKKKLPLLGLLGLLGLKKKKEEEEEADTVAYTTMHYTTTYAPKHYTKTHAPKHYTKTYAPKHYTTFPSGYH